MSLITIRTALEEILPELIAAVGERTTREIARSAADRMGAGGVTKEWLQAMGEESMRVGGQAAADAFMRGMARLRSGA